MSGNWRARKLAGLAGLATFILAIVPAVPAGPIAAAANSPGWRIVATVGSASSQVGEGDLVVTGPTDAWTAWTCGPCPSGKESHANLMLHWNGRRWSPVQLPGALRYPVAIAGLQASSARNLWAFDNNGRVAVFDGSRWAVKKLPNWVERPVSGNAVSLGSAVFSPANAWAFSLEATSQPTLAGHFAGGRWHKVFLPIIPAFAAGLASDDIWLYGFGKNFGPRTLAHWNGTSWRTVALPRPAKGTTLVASSPVPLGAKSLWMAGEVFPRTGKVRFELLHWTGRWSTVSVPASVGLINQLASDGDGGFWLIATRVEAGATGSRFVHFTGGRWEPTPIPTQGKLASEPGTLSSVPGSRSMWAIGFLVRGSVPEFGEILGFGRAG